MSDTDSFINEVSDELRSDRLYAMMRRYGWIALLLVLLLVGGAAWNEWRKASAAAEAEALGDSLQTALAIEDPAARAEALQALQVTGSGAVVAGLAEAGARAVASDQSGALAALDRTAGAEVPSPLYQELIALKRGLVLLEEGDYTQAGAIFDQLSVPGGPFRNVALEQKGLTLAASGDAEGALEVYTGLRDAVGVSPAMSQRVTQMIVALGGDPIPGIGS